MVLESEYADNESTPFRRSGRLRSSRRYLDEIKGLKASSLDHNVGHEERTGTFAVLRQDVVDDVGCSRSARKDSGRRYVVHNTDDVLEGRALDAVNACQDGDPALREWDKDNDGPYCVPFSFHRLPHLLHRPSGWQHRCVCPPLVHSIAFPQN